MRFGACRGGDGCVGAVAWRRLMGGRSPAGSSEARMAVLRADGAAGGSDGWLFGCLGVASGAVRIAGGHSCGCSGMRTAARRAVRIAAFGVGGSRLAAFIVRVPQAAPRGHVGKKRCGRCGRGGRCGLWGRWGSGGRGVGGGRVGGCGCLGGGGGGCFI